MTQQPKTDKPRDPETPVIVQAARWAEEDDTARPFTEHKVKILLVDDEPGNLTALEACLEGLGQTVVTARSGKDALRCVLDHDFAVILMDVRMPDMSGFETAELIRVRAQSRHIPIIFLTAYDPAEVQLFQGYSLGAVDYLHKPIVPQVLRSKVAVFVCLAQVTEQVKHQADLLRESQRQEHERQLLEERRRWEMERLREEAANEKRIATELGVAARRKDEFLAMLGHELRNPLAPILNALEAMRQAPNEPATVAAMHDIVVRQVHHISRLVDDLLDVARIERGKIQLRKQELELSTIIARAVDGTRAVIDARGHQLEVALPEAPLWVDADATRLEQVLANLLNNAAKYTKPGGRIWLSAALEGDQAVVRVRDTGVGISTEMLPHVFDLFAQADRSLDRSEGGLGIGLTLVRRLMELHGGAITAHSEGLGRGSEFVARLPAVWKPHPPRAAPTPNSAATRRTTRVLIVDDNRDAADSLATLLKMEGHEVCQVYDGPSALEAARQQRPAIIFLDLGLPGMDGYEVARQLRKQHDMKKSLLIALTGYGQEEDRRRCHDAGFDLHMVKPVELVTLREMLTWPALLEEP
jgi:signal transduction histidine kinase